MAESSLSKRGIERLFKRLAQKYVNKKRPIIIAVAGSVGKTSSKLLVAHFLEQEKKISFMDDSYNSGLGLYLSVFGLKVPTSKAGWPKLILEAKKKFRLSTPEVLILEYGIDHPGDMDEMINFVQPDIAMLTAVTPEHMEFLKDIDTVGQEETKILHAVKDFSVISVVDVDKKYLTPWPEKAIGYGHNKTNAHYKIKKWLKKGAVVNFVIENWSFDDVRVNFISEPLIRQLCGAALLAKRLGVSKEGLKNAFTSAQPAASRMRLFDGKNDSIIIDDTTNFSPNAGIESLKALKRLKAKRYIAVLGNMHELGEYENRGFSDVSRHFTGIDIVVLVGPLAKKYFGPLAKELGFIEGESLFYFDDAVRAGVYVSGVLESNDAVLVKGPFGGYYLEEAVKRMLKNSDDAKYLTRQSEVWLRRKKKIFGSTSKF